MQFGFMIPTGPDKNGKKATHPQEMERHRSRIRYGSGGKPYPQNYIGKHVVEAMEHVGQHTMFAMRKADIRKVTSEPLEITTVFFFSRTPTQQKAKIQIPFPSIKPDVDNLAKLVLDGMNEVLYTDDCKVVQGGVYKRFTHRDAHTFVGVRSLEDNEAMPPWDVYPHLEWCKEFYYKGW